MEQIAGRGMKGRLSGLWGKSSKHIIYMSENVFMKPSAVYNEHMLIKRLPVSLLKLVFKVSLRKETFSKRNLPISPVFNFLISPLFCPLFFYFRGRQIVSLLHFITIE